MKLFLLLKYITILAENPLYESIFKNPCGGGGYNTLILWYISSEKWGNALRYYSLIDANLTLFDKDTK